MILVDTSIWIDHLHRVEPALVDLLDHAQVLRHPMVVGELALGNLKDRESVLGYLADLPSVGVAGHDEVMQLVERRTLHGRGLSLVDAHLLASVLISAPARLWTRDTSLLRAATEVGVDFVGPV